MLIGVFTSVTKHLHSNLFFASFTPQMGMWISHIPGLWFYHQATRPLKAGLSFGFSIYSCEVAYLISKLYYSVLSPICDFMSHHQTLHKLIILNTKMTRLPMPESWERRNGDHKEFSNFMPEVYGSSWQYVLSHLYDYPYRNSQDFCHFLQWQKRLLSGMQEKLVLSSVVSA